MTAMVEMFLAPQNMPFSVALTIFVLLGLIEVITAGAADSIFEGIFPDLDVDLDVDLDAGLDADIDVDVETDIPVFTRLVGWVRVKNVPMLVLLVVFLFLFAVSGYFVQGLFKSPTGILLPAWLASIPAFVVAFPITRGLCTLLGRYVLEEHTSAVKTRDLVGRVGHITTGTATLETPAEARVEDSYGQPHYVFVTPKEGELKSQQKIVLVRKDGNYFKAVPFEDEEDVKI